jgi:[CysO sulfur-carrier protein]-S-L-cysteine hydrolase
LSIADCQFILGTVLIGNLKSAIGNFTTHPLRRGGTDLIPLRGRFGNVPYNTARLVLRRQHANEILLHAEQASPSECCGLIGGSVDGQTQSIYSLTNVAPNTEVAYEAAPEELFAAQRQMRQRGETLLAIYHSHPQASDPTPSETDVRLAYYPSAIYLIVGLAGTAPVVRAFTVSEQHQRWEQVEYELTDE